MIIIKLAWSILDQRIIILFLAVIYDVIDYVMIIKVGTVIIIITIIIIIIITTIIVVIIITIIIYYRNINRSFKVVAKALVLDNWFVRLLQSSYYLLPREPFSSKDLF